MHSSYSLSRLHLLELILVWAMAGCPSLASSSERRARPASPPSLPTELHRAILAFADDATLAIASRASYTFLEIASEFLYKDVEVVGMERLRRMFCERSANASVRLDALLSLSRIDSFTYVHPTYWTTAALPMLSFDRLNNGRPIEVRDLTIRFPLTPPTLGIQTESPAKDLTTFRHVLPSLLPLFNPACFVVAPVRSIASHRGDIFDFVNLPDWTELVEVRYTQCWVSALGPRLPAARTCNLPSPFEASGLPSALLVVTGSRCLWAQDILAAQYLPSSCTIGVTSTELSLRMAEALFAIGMKLPGLDGVLYSDDPDGLRDRLQRISVEVVDLSNSSPGFRQAELRPLELQSPFAIVRHYATLSSLGETIGLEAVWFVHKPEWAYHPRATAVFRRIKLCIDLWSLAVIYAVLWTIRAIRLLVRVASVTVALLLAYAFVFGWPIWAQEIGWAVRLRMDQWSLEREERWRTDPQLIAFRKRYNIDWDV